ncbi:MAG: InlB B-repeat-containing protein, partial [Clostridia bacterium]|nr:InlB B-repeat-containing protein [Clostridia bacterium]
MNPNSGRKKWVITIVIAAILIAAAVAVAIFAGPKPENPVVEKPAESPLGVYYYDTAEGEYLLTLSQGNVFMISGPSLNKSGKCVVTDNGIELDFVKDEDGTGAITIDGDVLNLQYKDKTMRFLEKKTFKVNFNVNGGSEVAAIDVVNGKTVAKPADPKKDGSVFIGWYADSACTQLYGFGNEVITADTTVYAKWAETVVGQNEYTVNFDLGYEAEGIDAMSTIGGKLYNVPTPARDGFTFAGWWVSMTENAEELTIPYVEDMVFQANTTLFALWTTTPEGGKLAAPMVEVYADSIKWNTIQGTSTYELKIFDANGVEIHSEKLGATTKTFDFATREAGEYTIQVTALASVEDKNSETTTRTFVNKALDRVSLFTVIDGGILLWNNVEGAEKYLITIDCGNDAHKHTAFDNGDSTTFMFKNCAMQEGGIKFTVTAVADGKASSVSETFVYDRKLDAV